MPSAFDADFLRHLGANALRFDAPADDPAAAPSADRVGAYELLEEIGRGGMGVVYTARQPGLERTVALKVMTGGRFATAEAESRFEREAQTAARLRHPHIVAVFESGRAEGRAYFSMEHFPDGDLARRLRERAFAPREAAVLMEKIAAAVAFAHREGVLHRDLKPSNVLLDGDDPRIADFGLASLLHEAGDLTARSAVLGTPGYLAPEGFTTGSAALGAAGDLYALGAMFYELLTGRAPFAGANPAELPGLVTTREPVSPRLLNPLVPRDFETICLKCLEKNPARRYASADALAEDLRRALADEPILARPPSPLGRFLRWCRRRPALAAAWLLLAVLAAVSAASAVVVARSNARATSQLRAALLAQARAAQLTGRSGQRVESLAALRTAAAIQPGLDLRDAALTALALPDARVAARWRPRFAITSPLAFDPSTERYVVESAEGLLTYRRRRDDAELRKLTPPPGRPRPVYIAPFAPDGGHFAVRFADGSAAVYETAQSEPRFVITGRPVRQTLVFFALDFCLTPDGNELVLPLPEGGVSFHDARTGAETGRIAAAVVPAVIAVAPDGARVALAGLRSEQVEIYERARGTCVARLVHPAPVANCAWRPDGRELATGCSDHHVHLWDAQSGRERIVLRGHRQVPTGLAWRADGRFLASSARDLSLRVWDVIEGSSALTVPASAGGAALGFSPDGRMLTFSSQDWEVSVLELSFGDVRAEVWRGTPGDFADEVFCLDASADGRLLVLASRSGVRLFDARGGAELANLRAAPGALEREFASTTEPILGAGARADDAAAQFNPRADTLVYSLGGSGTWRRALRWRDATTLELGPAAAVDPRRGLMVTQVSGDPEQVLLLGARAPLASVRALSGAGDATDFPLSGIPSGGVISPAGDAVITADFPGRVAKASDVRIWDIRRGAPVRALGLGAGGFASFSPDGGTLFANGGSEARLYDWPALTVVPSPPLALGSARFAPDGKLLAIAAEGRIALVRLPGAQMLGNLPGAAKASLRFDPTGGRLFVYEDFQLHVWDLRTLRRELAAVGLDWEGPPLPPEAERRGSPPVQVVFDESVSP